MTEETVECPVCSHTMVKESVTITATKAQTVSYRCKYCDNRLNIQTTKEEQEMKTTKRRCTRCGGFVSDRADQCKVCGLPAGQKKERVLSRCYCGGEARLLVTFPDPAEGQLKFYSCRDCRTGSRAMTHPDLAADEWEKMQARIKSGIEAETCSLIRGDKVLELLNANLGGNGRKREDTIFKAVRGLESFIVYVKEQNYDLTKRVSQLQTQLQQKDGMLSGVHASTDEALSSLGVTPSKESAVMAAERLAKLAATIGAKMSDLIAGKNDLLDKLTVCHDRIEQLEEKLAEDGLTHDSKTAVMRCFLESASKALGLKVDPGWPVGRIAKNLDDGSQEICKRLEELERMRDNPMIRGDYGGNQAKMDLVKANGLIRALNADLRTIAGALGVTIETGDPTRQIAGKILASLERRQALKQAVKKSREPDGEAWIVYDRNDATWMGQDFYFTTCGTPMMMDDRIALSIADSYPQKSIIARPITWTFKEGEE